jgi:TonB family protein
MFATTQLLLGFGGKLRRGINGYESRGKTVCGRLGGGACSPAGRPALLLGFLARNAEHDSGSGSRPGESPSDGTVTAARILKTSSDRVMDQSVQRALNRTPRLPAFPDGVTANELTYTIRFNLNAKLGY